MNEFDIKAGEWDSNQLHIDRSNAIAKALMNAVPLENSLKAMEYGAGTALLSFELKNKLQDITLMDSSTEMVRIMNEKIEAEKIRNMHPVLVDLETQYYPARFDLIYSQMVFHHIEKIDIVIKRFSKMLQPGGFVAIADLYPEDGTFHGDGFSCHKGFEPEYLVNFLTLQGFRNVQHKHCYTINKMINGNEHKAFPVFLMTAMKQ